MSDQTAIYVVAGLAAVFFALWIFSGKQKRKYEEARRQRKLELERIKAKARSKPNEE